MLDHHAYLCRVSVPKPEFVKSFVDTLGVSEIDYVVLDNFGISDVRALTEKAFVRPRIGEKQVIVVCFCLITIEAQQALLKLLEEPPTSAVFVFCVPKTLYLLPTLLSRFCSIEINSTDNENERPEPFINFLTLSLAERMNEITTRLAKKDTEWVEQIKRGLLLELVKPTQIVTKENKATLFWVAEHIQTRGASNKMLLEELTLTIKSAA